MRKKAKARISPKPKASTPVQKKISPGDIFDFLLTNLDLSHEHSAALSARGLSSKEIEKAGYKTFPQKRQDILLKLVRHFGDDVLNQCPCPGLWKNEKGERQLAGKSGIAIPIRNEHGNVTGIKIRVDKPNSQSTKYLLLSSNPEPDKKTGEVKYPFGFAAKVAVHYPLGRPKKCKTLRITEGELKADIATSMTDAYTISIPGVGMWRMAMDAIRELKPDRVLLSFDADKDQVTNKAYDGNQEVQEVGTPLSERFIVGRAVASLYLSIKSELTSLKIKELAIEDWPTGAGKGIDDVLVSSQSDKIKLLSGEEADEFCEKMLAEGMQGGWTYVVGVKRFYHNELLIELDKEQYADRFFHAEKGNPALNALRNAALPKVDLPIYMPNREAMFEQDGVKYFNVWRKGTLIPKQGCVKKFEEHNEYMIPNEAERNIFLDWLAYNIQNPGKKILYALLFQGIEGVGKSYYGWLMREMLGKKNVSLPSNEALHEMYTDWQKSCQLVIVEEVMSQGRRELMNKLKPIITQDVTMIREMRKPPYPQPNVFNLLMFTNYEDAILVDHNDRRYCVIFSPAKPREPKYYRTLFNWSQENKQQLFHFFLHRDLSKFDPLARAPMTGGKRILIAESMSPLQAWMEEAMATESWPFMGDLVSIPHLLACVPSQLRFVSTQAIGKALKACGAQSIGQFRMSGGNGARLWSVRRHEIWEGASEASVVAAYEKFAFQNEPGGTNPLLEASPM